jgi:Domain of unknown function (DUF4279)
MYSEDKKWYRASLRLSGDLLPIDEIESKLGLKASSIGKKGLPLNNYKSQILNTPLKTNIWCSEKLAENDVPLENQIELYLEKLEPKKEFLREILSLPDVEGEFFLGFSSENGQGGAYFSAELLKKVSDLGLSLSFDLYPPSDFEENNNE